MNAAKAEDLDRFSEDVDTRISRRTAAAQPYMEATQAGLGAKAGLMLANTADRVYSLTRSPRVAFWSGALNGGIKGSLIGFGMFVALAAMQIVAPVTVPLLLCVGIGAAIVGGYEGVVSRKEAIQNGGQKSGFIEANTIARQMGALPPAPERSIEKPMNQVLEESGLDPMLTEKVETELKRPAATNQPATPSPERASFVSRVEQSRASPANVISR